MWAIVVASGVAGAVAGCRPTGLRVLDVLYAGVFAAVVTAGASRARRVTVLWLTFFAAALSRGWLLIPGAASLAVAFAAGFQERRHRVVGAVAGALAVQAVLRWPHDAFSSLDFQGFTAIVAVVAVIPPLFSAYRQLRRRDRRRVGWGVAAVVAVAVILSVPVAVAGLTTKTKVDQAISETRGALTLAAKGETTTATAQLRTAAAQLSSADGRVGAWWTAGARLVPVVAQQRQAFTRSLSAARVLTAAVSGQAGKLDTARVGVRGGKIPLTGLSSLSSPLDAVGDDIGVAKSALAHIPTDWVVSPIVQRIRSLDTELTNAGSTDRLASQALRELPGILGASGPRHYFVALLNPAESRGLGGLISAYGLLTVDNGKVSLTSSGRTGDLDQAPAGSRKITGPADYLARYGEFKPQDNFQDLSYSPDFPTVAQVIDEMYPQSGGSSVDGVLAIDPQALAAILKMTGPITVAGAPYKLTSQNVVSFLERGEYTAFSSSASGNQAARHDFLEAAMRAAFDRLTSRTLPNPISLARSLGPAVSGGHLFFWSFHRSEQPLLKSTGIAGAFPLAGGGDLLSVVTQNAGNNKLDAYLQRTIDDRVTYDPGTGQTTATVTVALHNEAPPGLPSEIAGILPVDRPAGTNRTWLTLYTPLGEVAATVDGNQVGVSSTPELGVNAYSDYVDVPPQSTVTLTFRLTGRLAAGDTYDLRLRNQPAAIPDREEISVIPATGWVAKPPSSTTWTPGPVSVQTHSVIFRRDG